MNLNYFLLAPLLALFIHKFYVSNTNIDWNNKNSSLEITVKIFTDDLERALDISEIDLYKAEPTVIESDQSIKNYVISHFIINVDDTPSVLHSIGKETEVDLTYLYFEVLYVPDFHHLTVQNTLLTEIYPEQKNIIDLSINGWQKTIIFTKDYNRELIYK